MNTKPATFAAAGTVLLWASAFPAITVAVRGLGPAGLAVARLAVASAALAVAAPADGGPPTQAGGPAADRAVRAGRDDRVPAAAQRRGAGGARGHGQPAGGDRAGVRQPAGGGVPGRARDPPAPCQPALGWQRGGAGRHRADRRLARARVRHVGADRAGRGGAPGDLPHRAEAAAGPVHRLRGDRLRHVGRHRIRPAVDRVAAAGAGRRTRAGRPSARRSSSAWRRPRPGSCCGPTPWRGRTSGGSRSACTWCRPPRSGSRWSGWARSLGRPS